MSESTRAHWDSFWGKGNLDYIRKTVEELSAIDGIQGKKILEIGAGSGATSIKLAESGGNVTCLDYSKISASLIRKNAQVVDTQVSIIVADAHAIPIEDESYDICFHQGFLEHFREVTPLLKEQHRILKPGGYILIDVPQRFNFYTLRKRLLIATGKWFAGWETEYTLGLLKKVLRNHNFEFIRAFGRYHVRNIDRIQMKLFKRRVLPKFFERVYYSLIRSLENSPVGCYSSFSIGAIGKKM